MTLTQARKAALIYNMDYYTETIDANGEQSPALSPDAPTFPDAFAQPVTAANKLRRDVIEATVNGRQIMTEGLSDWAKGQLVHWVGDAQRIIALGVKAEPVNPTRITRYDGDDSLGIYTREGAVVMECENGVVIEWDGCGNDSGYSDLYKTLALYEPGSDKGKLLPGPWDETYSINERIQ